MTQDISLNELYRKYLNYINKKSESPKRVKLNPLFREAITRLKLLQEACSQSESEEAKSKAEEISSTIAFLEEIKDILKDKEIKYLKDDTNNEKGINLASKLDNLIDFYDSNTANNSSDINVLKKALLRHLTLNTDIDFNWILYKKEVETISNSINDLIISLHLCLHPFLEDPEIINHQYEYKRLSSLSILQSKFKKPKIQKGNFVTIKKSSKRIDLSSETSPLNLDEYLLKSYFNRLKTLFQNLKSISRKLSTFSISDLKKHLEETQIVQQTKISELDDILSKYLPQDYYKDEDISHRLQADSGNILNAIRISIRTITSYLKFKPQDSHTSNNFDVFLKDYVLPEFESYIESYEYIENFLGLIEHITGLLSEYNLLFYGNNKNLNMTR